MLHFNEKEFLEKQKNALKVIPETQKIVDEEFKKGFSNVFLVGIGGTLTVAWEMESMLRSYSTLDFWVENAAEFTTKGNKRFTKDSLVIVSSDSGDTPEVLAAVKYAREQGATVIGQVAKEGTPIGEAVSHCVINADGSTLYWYTVTFRLMNLRGEFPKYDQFVKELENLPAALLDVKESFEAQGEAWAEKYMDEPIHYFTGAGNSWGTAYCFAMCYLEEMAWMRTKSIHCAEFFHGTLEVIERDVPLTIYKGEDETRPLADRVEAFAHKISRKVEVIDSKQFALKGISEEFRGLLSPIVLAHAQERIMRHLEHKRRHPQPIRRYYRCLDY